MQVSIRHGLQSVFHPAVFLGDIFFVNFIELRFDYPWVGTWSQQKEGFKTGIAPAQVVHGPGNAGEGANHFGIQG